MLKVCLDCFQDCFTGLERKGLWHHTFCSCEACCAPSCIRMSSNYNKPWFTSRLRQLRWEKKKALRDGGREFRNRNNNSPAMALSLLTTKPPLCSRTTSSTSTVALKSMKAVLIAPSAPASTFTGLTIRTFPHHSCCPPPPTPHLPPSTISTLLCPWKSLFKSKAAGLHHVWADQLSPVFTVHWHHWTSSFPSPQNRMQGSKQL